jgi:hypothetical protein
MKSSLASAVDRMLIAQAVEWPLLARNLQGLRQSQTRSERVFGREVLVRHIPHRIKSTTAPVDAASVAARKCFLCPESLYPEQRGESFNADFTIYANPFPILEGHLTIVHREHRPQLIAGQFDALLHLAAALPDSFIIYNGPACGASAPDHLHFQGCSRDVFPIGRDSLDGGFVPRVFALRGRSSRELTQRLERLMQALGEVVRAAPEPMVNIAAFRQGDEWTVLVFPRSKHRPRVYETGELTVSPATIDLCGVFVVPVPSDFERIRAGDIENILSEVTLPVDLFNQTLNRVGGKP